MRKKLQSTLYISVLFLAALSCKSESKELEESSAVAQQVTLDTLVKMYPDSVEILVKYGQQEFEKFNYKTATPTAIKAFRLDSNNLEARLLYARILNNKPGRSIEEVATAQRHFAKVLEYEPKNLTAMIELAATYSLMQDYEKSFDIINTALRIDPRFRDGYILKGTNYVALGKMDLAKSSYETAVQQDPSFWFGYLNLGNLYMQEKNPICIEYYRTAVSIKPEDMDLLYALAYAHQLFEQPEEALTVYREMLEVDSSFAMANFQMGHIKQFQQAQRDSAIYFYNEALVMEPRFVEAWHNLGMCHEANNDRPKALQAYARALKYDPEFELSREAANRLR